MKKMMILGCLILSFAPLAWGQEKCEAPVWNVGDQWTYGDKSGTQSTDEVIGIENDIYVMRYGEQSPKFDTGEVGICGVDKNTMNLVFQIDKNNRKTKFTAPRSKVLDFPLYVGKKWRNTSIFSGQRASGPLRLSEEYSVSSYEDVKIVGGTFKAFKIEYRDKSMQTGKDISRATYWYSPEVKAIVKRVEYVARTVGNTELISYKLAQ